MSSKKQRVAPAGGNGAGASRSSAGEMTAVRLLAGVLKIFAKYQAIEQARAGHRRMPEVERSGEEGSQLKPFDRLQAIAIGRDLNRNNPKAITIINQREVLTLGKVKAQFNTENDVWNSAASRIFNVKFARDCWFSDAAHLETVAQWVEGALIREGDILVAFDDFLLDTGKLMIWEADQLVDPEKADWERCEHPYFCTRDGHKTAYLCDQGVIRDEFGRVAAFAVSSLNLADNDRARITLPLADCMLIPADRARLIRNRFRPGQRRGVPALLPVAGNLADIEEMVQSELSTARMRSKIMAWVKRAQDNGLSQDAAQEVAEFLQEQAGVLDTDVTAADTSSSGSSGGDGVSVSLPAVTDGRTYRNIEEAVGGLLDYLEDGDDIQIPNIDRPNLNTATFFDQLGDTAGASLGLARGYTRMAVSSSYTAHRGETCMTDRHIRRQQKQHEHDWLDWLAVKVIERAIRLGLLAEGPEDWQDAISWGMPKPDQIDPEKEARAQTLAMKNGAITLRDAAGPDWKRKFADFAAQLSEARKLGLPLSVFETVAGAVMPEAEEPVTEPTTEEE